MSPSHSLVADCPCGSGEPLAVCCQPLHRGARAASTAEELMRSRYAAFALGEVGYLTRTWHPRTRPVPLDLDATQDWQGLSVLDVAAGGADDETGEVAFEACYERAGVPGVLAERSRFERRRGQWVYVDRV
ncbi:YchJ family protein [Nocardioides acrostichi]|uniref:UPF0225 protein ISG29_03870 n=1 Tax=Nocardioides acrostichi TaxID=2784339 RepID=A0A930UU02_9ACTN|nr:YchJ family metal-binding protein [Nocardioides acrostichi]MBF4160813.1 SEC-C domain-containing protein [Nocardioides acrostichi]